MTWVQIALVSFRQMLGKQLPRGSFCPSFGRFWRQAPVPMSAVLEYSKVFFILFDVVVLEIAERAAPYEQTDVPVSRPL